MAKFFDLFQNFLRFSFKDGRFREQFIGLENNLRPIPTQAGLKHFLKSVNQTIESAVHLYRNTEILYTEISYSKKLLCLEPKRDKDKRK